MDAGCEKRNGESISGNKLIKLLVDPPECTLDIEGFLDRGLCSRSDWLIFLLKTQVVAGGWSAKTAFHGLLVERQKYLLCRHSADWRKTSYLDEF